jgi:hypothetical protein
MNLEEDARAPATRHCEAQRAEAIHPARSRRIASSRARNDDGGSRHCERSEAIHPLCRLASPTSRNNDGPGNRGFQIICRGRVQPSPWIG